MKARAPGKLFVAGEYAVLYGGIALVAAVDRFVEVEDGSDAYRLVGGDTGDLRLPQLALKHAGRPELLAQLRVDVSAFFHPTGAKLGFGSSAASMVAIVRAARPSWSPREVYACADAAHRELQHGKGSGADIAASSLGGVLAYALPVERCLEPWIGSGGALDHVELPPGVRIEAVWLGAPARSVKMVQRVHDRVDEVLPTLREIAATGERCVEACRHADASAFLKAFTEGDLLAERLGESTGAPIVIDAHRELRALASEYGLVAKPSGAGGGDFSLVAGPIDAVWGDALASFAEAGLEHVPLKVGVST